MNVFLAVVSRDLRAMVRQRSAAANPLLFFLMVGALFPLGLGPEAEQLAAVAPGVIWVVALLSAMLASDAMFRSDYDDATLEQMLLSPSPLFGVALGKVIAHWLASGVPLALVSPLLALMLQLPTQAIPALVMSLLLGTLCISLVGGIGAALTVGLKRGGLLLAVLVIPLYFPVLIFAASAVQSAAEGFPWLAQCAVLAAFALLGSALAPWAIVGALKISVDQ